MKHTGGMNGAQRVLREGEGDCYRFLGLACRVLLPGEASGGAYTLIEITAEPGKGSPFHVCNREDKLLYVVEGFFRIRAGQETVTATRGTVVRIPRGVPHSFVNADACPSRLLASLAPAGHDRFFEELASLPQPPEPAAFEALLARFGMTLVPEPETGPEGNGHGM